MPEEFFLSLLILLFTFIIGIVLIYLLPFPTRDYYSYSDLSISKGKCNRKSILVNSNPILLDYGFFETYTLLEIRGDKLYLVEKDYNKSLLKSGDFILCEKTFGPVLAKIIDSGKKSSEGNIDFVVREVVDPYLLLNNCYTHSFTATTDKGRCCSIIGKVLINKRVKYYGKKDLSNKRKS